jgi:hypothetical protein
MNDKTIKNSKSKNLNAIVTASNVKTQTLRETAKSIEDTIKSHDASDVDVLKKLRLDCCNAESRAARSNKVAIMSDADAATFALFAKLHNSDAKLEAFFSRAIYVQDKLRTCITAIARNVALSTLTRNNSTRVVLRELLANASDRKSLLSALVRDCAMSANTASSQVSSSLIALSHLAIIEHDSATKRYSVRATESETANALAA